MIDKRFFQVILARLNITMQLGIYSEGIESKHSLTRGEHSSVNHPSFRKDV